MATGYQPGMGNQPSTTRLCQSGWSELQPTIPCARNTWDCRYPTSRSLPIGTAASDGCSPGAKPSLMPRLAAIRRRPHTGAIAVGRERLESSSPALQAGVTPFSYQPK